MAAILPILMVFVMQFAVEQQNQGRIAALQEMVYSAKEQAKQEGRFTPAMKTELGRNIAKYFELDESEVVIEADSQIRYRRNRFDERELISYAVKVPIKKIMAGNRMMGISDEDNTGLYVIRGETASERLPN
jgi:septum formation topological specificity factor MinE